MKVEVIINKEMTNDKIIIYAKEKDSKIESIVNYIQNMDIIAYKNNESYILNLDEIESFYTEAGRIVVRTVQDKYITKNRIYELEEKLKNTRFIRISNSEIVNIDKVQKMEYGTGNICLYFKSNNFTYVSRRYIKRVKEFIYKEVGL